MGGTVSTEEQPGKDSQDKAKDRNGESEGRRQGNGQRLRTQQRQPQELAKLAGEQQVGAFQKRNCTGDFLSCTTPRLWVTIAGKARKAHRQKDKQTERTD